MNLPRAQVKEEDRWNVSALYPSFDLWQKEYATIQFTDLLAYKGRLEEGPDLLAALLEKQFSLARKLEKLYTYAHLRHDEETVLDEPKAAYQSIVSKLHDFQESSSWIEPEILHLPEEKITSYLASEKLRPYLFYLEKIVRMRPHTLSEREEKLLALSAGSLDTPSKAFSALNNADFKFGKVVDGQGEEKELTHGLYQLYLRSPDRTLRKNAFTSLHGKFDRYKNTLAELLYGQIKAHLFQAKSRNFRSCLEAALFPKNIPLSVYHNLIQTVRKHLPLLHRYIRLRKKVLQVETLHLYDLYVPLVEKVDLQLSYEESEKLVIDSVAPLGKEYQETLRKGLLQERWVDRYENENKRSGAYSSGCYDSFPYILMNYRGIVRDTFTLAHEAGHSMHSYFSNTYQAYHDSHYPIFVAEVASTFNEELLMNLLLKKFTKKKEQLFLLNEKLEDIRTTFFRQTMFAEFELTLHEQVENGLPLTPASLHQLYYKLNCDYFGPDCHIDEEIAIEWARIPHFYYNFYVYQYATGISAAISLAEKVEESESCTDYLSFLKGGGSLFPIDLLKLAGIDMTQSTPVETTLQKFSELLTEFEKNL